RHSWQTLLRGKIRTLIKISEICYENDDEDDTESITDDESDGLIDEDKKLFKFDIPYRDYIKMSPINIKYGKKILKQGVWTNIINDWFIKLCSIQCNIIYKRCRVQNDDKDGLQHYLTFSGKCKDCQASVFGWVNKKPKEAMALVVDVIVQGMKMNVNHKSKRPLNGAKRCEVGKELFHECASNWKRKAQIFTKKSVLRKCKQEESDKALGITIKCPIMSLIQFKHTKYAGSIHLISADPLIVHYWTPCQLVFYKSIRKSYVRLTIDATGSIVKKIKRTTQNILSSHIFLYEGVLSSDEFQVSVLQMISEKQNTFTIYSWLQSWLNDGVLPPQETVTDCSMALLGAIARAFCGGITVNFYVNTCLEILLHGKSSASHQLQCYMRIDIAHLIKLVCRWKCWQEIKSQHLKQFFVRCTVLLIKAEELFDFQYTLVDILIVASSQYDGQLVNSQINSSSEDARIRLLERIKGTNCSINNEEYLLDTNSDNELENDEMMVDLSNSNINEFLQHVVEKSKSNSSIPGDRLNAYYIPDFCKNILKICKLFPLWSNVMRQFFNSPYSTATSASVESNFAGLKNNILKHNSKPLQADRFVITHLISLESSIKLAKIGNNKVSSPQEIEQNSIIDHEILYFDTNISSINNQSSLEAKNSEKLNSKEPSPKEFADELNIPTICSSESVVDNSSFSSDSSDTLLKEETWKGYKNNPTGPLQINKNKNKRHFKYTNPCPEIDRILNSSRMRSHKKTLLLNGNISNQYKIKGHVPICCNKHIDYVSNQNNELLLFSKTLASNGGTNTLYNARAELLKKHFKELLLCPKVHTINCECNVTKIVECYLQDVPSAVEHIRCENCEESTKTSPTIILSLNNNTDMLEEMIQNYLKVKQSVCFECQGTRFSTRVLNQHLFIETEYITNMTLPIKDFPKIVNEKYHLVAVVNFFAGHYTTYIRRISKNVWEIHNDLSQKIKIATSENEILHPHILMYNII
ncbi:Uncharacterized protein FWK35_00030290, partial [Aphis craccivora]